MRTEEEVTDRGRRPGRTERVLIGWLGGLTLLPALLIGGVHPQVQVAMLVGVAGALALLLRCRLGKPYRRQFGVARTLLPAMAAALGMTLLQRLPLPPMFAAALDPKADWLRQLGREAGAGGWWPISLAPSATTLELVKQATCLGACLVATYFLHRSSRAMPLVRTFWAGGTALAGIALLQRALHARRILGLYQPDWSDGFMATFVDANHAVGFFLLVVGAAIALVLAEKERRRRLIALASLALPLIAILSSTSRAGLVGLAVLFVTVLGMGVADGRRRKQTLLAAGALLGLLTGGLAVSYEGAARRLELGGPLRQDHKVLGWKDALAMANDFPWTGVGRGAFAEVFPHFNRANRDVTVTHAENLVVQAIAEWGYPFTILLTAVALVAGIALFRKTRGNPMCQGLLAGLLALFVQNLFDFNLEFPGTALPAAILLGLLLARSTERPRPDLTALPRANRWAGPRVLGGCAVGCGLLALLALPAIHHTLRLEERALTREIGAAKSLQPLAGTVEVAVLRHPTDYGLQMLAGMLYLHFGDVHGLRHLNTAMALNPLAGGTHLQAARALASAGRKEQAALEYRAAFERTVPLTEAALTEVLARSGSVTVAEEAIPERTEALLTFAYYLEQHGRLGDARRIYGHLAHLAPASDPALLAALRALLRLGEPHPLELAQRLARITPLANDVALAAAAIHKGGQVEAANQVYLDALPRFPTEWSVVGPAVEVLEKHGRLVAAQDALQPLVEQAVDRAQRAAALEKMASLQENLGQAESARHSRRLAQQLRALGN